MARILIIDDDILIRRLIEEQLLTQGYEIVSAPTAEKGYLLALQSPPDLILLDVNLPDITGFQMCGRFRKNPVTQFIPIIMMTGAATWPNQQVIGRQMGANEYILKPFDVFDLGKRVQALVNSGGPVHAPPLPPAAPALEASAPIQPQIDEAPVVSEPDNSETGPNKDEPPPTAGSPAESQQGGDQVFSDFSVEVLNFADQLPRTRAGTHAAEQLLKCGTAVGARFNESLSAESLDEALRFRGAALKELRETGYWLMLIRKSGLLETPLVEALEKKCRTLSAALAEEVTTPKPIV